MDRAAVNSLKQRNRGTDRNGTGGRPQRECAAGVSIIGWALENKIAAREMNFIGYLSPILGIEKYLNKDLANDPTINSPSSALARYQTSAPSPKFLQLANQVYDAFKAA